MFKLGVLISGGGTTMQAVINECIKGSLKNKINPVMVIASCKCAGIVKAKHLSIPTFLLERKKFPKGKKGQREYGIVLLSLLKKKKVDIITQNGWLPLTPKNVIKAYKNRIFNQHPGPLDSPYPDFGGKGMFGLRVHATVLYFSKMIKRRFFTEATVQRVDENFDHGEVLLRQTVRIEIADTPETLAKRVLPFEHQLQIKLLKLFAANKLEIYTRRNRLIKKDEIEILKQAKEKSLRVYPES